MLQLMLHYDADIHIKNNNDESVKDIYIYGTQRLFERSNIDQ